MKLAIHRLTERTMQELVRRNLPYFKQAQSLRSTIGYAPSTSQKYFNIGEPYPLNLFQQFFLITAFVSGFQVKEVIPHSVSPDAIVCANNSRISPKAYHTVMAAVGKAFVVYQLYLLCQYGFQHLAVMGLFLGSMGKEEVF